MPLSHLVARRPASQVRLAVDWCTREVATSVADIVEAGMIDDFLSALKLRSIPASKVRDSMLQAASQPPIAPASGSGTIAQPSTFGLGGLMPGITQAVSDATEAEPLPSTSVTASNSAERTLASSRFLAAYSQPESRPEHLYQLESAVHSLIRAHAQGAGVPSAEADAFFRTLRTNAIVAAMDGGVADEFLKPEQLMYIAVRLWTSAATLRGRELCSLLNQALREDAESSIAHAATITHAINTFCVVRRGGTPVTWPADHYLYRGAAMPRCHQGFFTVDKAYRAPMFVATSLREDVSVHTFLMRLPAASASQSPPFQEPILWRFRLDGSLPESRRCVHVNFIDRTDGTVHGEDEFLFAPYSVFTVRHVEWKSQPTVNAYAVQPHIIEVDVASDNLRHPPNLPLAPWC